MMTVRVPSETPLAEHRLRLAGTLRGGKRGAWKPLRLWTSGSDPLPYVTRLLELGPKWLGAARSEIRSGCQRDRPTVTLRDQFCARRKTPMVWQVDYYSRAP